MYAFICERLCVIGLFSYVLIHVLNLKDYTLFICCVLQAKLNNHTKKEQLSSSTPHSLVGIFILIQRAWFYLWDAFMNTSFFWTSKQIYVYQPSSEKIQFKNIWSGSVEMVFHWIGFDWPVRVRMGMRVGVNLSLTVCLSHAHLAMNLKVWQIHRNWIVWRIKW